MTCKVVNYYNTLQKIFPYFSDWGKYNLIRYMQQIKKGMFTRRMMLDVMSRGHETTMH